MAMLARYRRYWAIVVFAILAMPLCVQLIEPRATQSMAEGRLLAEPPDWSSARRNWPMAVKRLGAFLDDHFGLRDMLIEANALVRYALYSSSSPRVIVGRSRWLFYTGDSDIQQSAGLLIRKDAISQFAAFVAALDGEMRRRSIAFLFTSPPNATTMLRAYLPSWAAAVPAVTEYDLVLKALAERGVPAVDLRLPLAAEQQRRSVYVRSGTHWNALGALIGYNAAVRALGKNDWAIDPDRVMKGEAAWPSDLERMLGISGALSETVPKVDMSSYSPPAVQTSTEANDARVYTTSRPGPVVVVFGDSFTQDFWPEYFSLHVSQLVWMPHNWCHFTLDDIETYHPDIVIYAPTERYLFCSPNPPLLAR